MHTSRKCQPEAKHQHTIRREKAPLMEKLIFLLLLQKDRILWQWDFPLAGASDQHHVVIRMTTA